MSLPTFTDFSPAKNFVGVVRNSPVFFKIRSADGIQLTSIKVRIEGNLVIDHGVFQPGYSGTIYSEDPYEHVVSIVILHVVDFDFNQEVNVAITVKDQLANEGNVYYKFITTTSSDRTAPEVVANPHGALYKTAQNISLLSEPAATIYYTLDGSEPDLGSAQYTTPIPVGQGITTLKFFGIDISHNYSVIRKEVYDINLNAGITTANPPGGNLFNSVNVELNCSDSKATIFYSVDGSTPTTNSQVYSTPITIQENKITTLKYFSVDKYGNTESIKTETYTIEAYKNNYIVRNVFVTTPFVKGILDLRWEDMYPINNKIVGYNVYRADVEIGPYRKLNRDLIAINQYQDKTLDVEILEEDVSEQFRRTVSLSSEVNDNFQGKCFDEHKWIESDFYELMFPLNGLLFIDKTGLAQDARLTSTYKLHGDFDIRIDYDLLTWGIPNSKIQSSLFRVKKDDQNFIQVGRERSQTANVYSSNRFYNGNPDLPISIPTIDVGGSFKITRSGNLISTYFYEQISQSYITIHTFNAFADDVYVEIAGVSSDINTQLRWANYQVINGNPYKIMPLNERAEYVIQTSKYPIVDSSGSHQQTDVTSEVSVSIDGKKGYVRYLRGFEGVIILETDRVWDELTRTWFEPPKPNEHSTVLVTYKVNNNSINTALRKNYFYKVTCVTNVDETDLDLIKPEYLSPAKVDFMYEEAIRRNQWLLDQAGERVLLFIKKKAGQVCRCLKHDIKLITDGRAEQDCEFCYGAGFEGGYDGPFAIIVAPLTTEQRLTQTDRGAVLKYQIETWMGPTPLISQRDMIVRRNYDRVLLGPITRVEGPRGSIVQQHFVVEPLDTTDVRYKFPLQPLPNYTQQPGIDKPGTTMYEISSPKEREELITNKGVDHVVRGRSINFENTNY